LSIASQDFRNGSTFTPTCPPNDSSPTKFKFVASCSCRRFFGCLQQPASHLLRFMLQLLEDSLSYSRRMVEAVPVRLVWTSHAYRPTSKCPTALHTNGGLLHHGCATTNRNHMFQSNGAYAHGFRCAHAFLLPCVRFVRMCLLVMLGSLPQYSTRLGSSRFHH
jgi:hypothetical protein